MTFTEYLSEHGINEKSVEAFKLTSNDNYMDIPVKDEEGKLAFIKSRNLNYTKDGTEPKYKNSLGSHAILFNYHAVKDSEGIVICEGEIDAIRLTQAGIPAVTSTGGATTFPAEWASFFANKLVWVCLDNDEAGRKGLRAILDLVPHAKAITLPEGTKDVCEYFQASKKADFVTLMRNALTKSEYEAINRPPEFSLVSASDIEKMEFPEHPWLIDNILYSEGFCFIYGAEGTGKSFIALDIAKAVATGTDWLGKFKTKQANVLFLDKENPLSMTKRRIAGIGLNQPNVYWLEYPEKFQLSDSNGNMSEFALALSAIVAEKNIGLIIIDSFVDLMVGNESSSGDTQIFFDAVRSLFPHIAYIPLHHENKPSQGLFRNDSQRLRGSSNINAQTFTMFRLEAVAKSKTEITLKQTKARDSQRLDKFMVKMIIKTNTDRSTTVTGFEYVGDVPEGDVDAGKTTEVEEMILEMLASSNGVSRPQIVEAGTAKGVSERTITSTIKKMLTNGDMNDMGFKDREKWYTSGLFTPEKYTETLDDLDGNVD